MALDKPEAADEMRCPTCRARQAWSAACRRCGSDLTLLQRFAARIEWNRKQCLLALSSHDVATALVRARALFDLRPDSPARRLLGTCLLLNGEYEQARRLVPRVTGQGAVNTPESRAVPKAQ